MTDYDNYSDNLAFEPEFTWGDLLEWVDSVALNLIERNESITIYENSFFLINNICFTKCGNVLTDERAYIAKNRTPRQMRVIIKTLYE